MRPGATGRYQTYMPTPRQALFHAIPAFDGSGRLIKGFVGGLGGGKSTACENELIELCLRFPGGTSVAVRKSMTGRVELSVLKDLKKMLQANGTARWIAGDGYFLFPNGHQLHVKSAESVERFGSMDICAYFIQEAQEVTGSIFSVLNARLRDPAARWNGQPYYRGLFDARGVTQSHWIYEKFIQKAWNVDDPASQREHAEVPDFVYVKSKTDDNLQNLPADYKKNLLIEHKDDASWIDVYLEGETGIEVEGRPVFGSSFDKTKHIAEIREDPGLRIMRGWDFGYRAPAVVWCQWTRKGQLFVLRELCPKNVSTDALVDEVLAFQAAEFPGRSQESFVDFADVAGEAVQSTSSLRDLEILEDRLGTTAYTRKGSIEYGLNILRGLMTKNVKVQGSLQPRFLVDISCQVLISALKGSYSYPEDNPSAPPNKGGSYVAAVDCTRYIAQQMIEEGFTEIYEGYGTGRRDQNLVMGKW
jgi:Phage terminase large subunit